MGTRNIIRTGRIDYLNVAPVYYGFDNGPEPKDIQFEIIRAAPSELNRMTAMGELDVGPVSSVAYAYHQEEWLLLPGLSVACSGKVMSVLLVGRVPFHELEKKKVLLTSESASAAALLKLFLAKQGISPEIITGVVRNPLKIDKDIDAVLVIGDSALDTPWDQYFPYVIDLGELWCEMTGLPFIFALWVVRKSYAQKNHELVLRVVDFFNKSKEQGYENIERIAAVAADKLKVDIEICRKYYRLLNSELGTRHIQGLKTFYEMLYDEKIIPKRVKVAFIEP